MKKIKKLFMVFFAATLLTSGMTVFAVENVTEDGIENTQPEIQPRANGCGNWKITYGTPYCSNQYCPAGFKRRLRNKNYKRTCIRDNNTTYTEKKSEIVYVACDCR